MPSNLKITNLTLIDFKRVKKADLDLTSTNILVGGNNSGKSSVLQGIHFSVCAAIAARSLGRVTFSQAVLLYCPARRFVNLRHGHNYTNQYYFSHLSLKALTIENRSVEYKIRIYRGRNEGNVGCERTGDPIFGQLITNTKHLFSIYVPGLAGIPQAEEYRTESVIRRGVAGGDANLYLRNVMLLIKKYQKLDRLRDLMRSIFPSFDIKVKFEEKEDVYISVNVKHRNSQWCPLELAGTGVLQALQIFSYITLFEPSLLLLDEPDSHLHPDNQGILANTMQTVSTETDTQIILSTHSRHLVEALRDEANFIWLKNGIVVEQGIGLDRLPLLLDLGALDSFDKLQAGEIDWVVLTEDSKLHLIKTLLERSSYNLAKTAIYSYKSSSKIQSAISLCEFIKDVAVDTKIIIHRDRDMMISQELSIVTSKIEKAGGIPFITAGSDLETYFIETKHLSALLDCPEVEIDQWVKELAISEHIQLQHSFTRKRDELKYSLYRGRKDECPDTLTLIGSNMPLAPSHRLGKTMLKAIRTQMKDKFSKVVDPIQLSNQLKCPELEDILKNHI